MTKSERLRAESKEISRGHKEMSGIAKDAAQEQLRHVRENAAECYEQGQDKACSATNAFERCVRERPVASVLIAAGVGVLVGRFGMHR